MDAGLFQKNNNFCNEGSQMKRFLKWLLRSLAKGIAFVLHPLFVRLIHKMITNITTEYIAKQLLACGKNPTIGFPITSHGLRYIKIGENFRASSGLILEAYDRHFEEQYTPEITIGDNVIFNYDCHIGCVNKIVIGNGVLIASKVYITDHFHGDTTKESLKLPPNSRKVFSKGAVIIEDNVWIGEGVVIMPNVTIGKNAIIGANAVVTKDVPANSVAVGNPAKIIKTIEASHE